MTSDVLEKTKKKFKLKLKNLIMGTILKVKLKYNTINYSSKGVSSVTNLSRINPNKISSDKLAKRLRKWTQKLSKKNES